MQAQGLPTHLPELHLCARQCLHFNKSFPLVCRTSDWHNDAITKYRYSSNKIKKAPRFRDAW